MVAAAISQHPWWCRVSTADFCAFAPLRQRYERGSLGLLWILGLLNCLLEAGDSGCHSYWEALSFCFGLLFVFFYRSFGVFWGGEAQAELGKLLCFASMLLSRIQSRAILWCGGSEERKRLLYSNCRGRLQQHFGELQTVISYRNLQLRNWIYLYCSIISWQACLDLTI